MPKRRREQYSHSSSRIYKWETKTLEQRVHVVGWRRTDGHITQPPVDVDIASKSAGDR